MKKSNMLMVLGIIVFLALVITTILPKETYKDSVKKFNSNEELKNYLKQRQVQNNFGYYSKGLGVREMALSEDSGSSPTYSKTNIQVEGVDEPDIVKNDGKYIYVLSGENLSIIQAYPGEDAEILSILNLDGIPNDIFINENKLVVFGQERYNYNDQVPLLEGTAEIVSPKMMLIREPWAYTQKSFIKIYNVEDKYNPKLERNIVYEGGYYDARMINNYVYVIVNQPISYRDDNVILPMIKDNERILEMPIDNIYYFDVYDDSYRLTTILSLDLNNLNDPEKKMFLTGYTQNIYVSEKNIYLTSQKQIPYYDYQKLIFEKTIIPLVDLPTQDNLRNNLNDPGKVQSIFEEYYNKLSENEKQNLMQKMNEKMNDAQEYIQKETQKTIIHKIEINNNINYKSRGEVPGIVLNQFSMDEYKDNFRIATTTGWGDNSLNHMYNLDENLNIIGKLEDLAHGEKIYSVRFMKDRAYLVTFKQTDPLFVIDLSNNEPRILGELKIPGYSDYLHPYDETHIIGIGKEAVESQQGNFALYQGVKLSLFDVSDVNNPIEISKYNIGDRGTDSEALHEHKAFLFDKDKNLLVLPISLHEVKERNNQPGFDPNAAYGELTYEGAYTFSLNLEEGFKLKGRLTHLNQDEINKLKEEKYYYQDYNSKIRRSLYINNNLYTVSGKYIKINNLDNLDEIKTIELPFNQESYPIVLY